MVYFFFVIKITLNHLIAIRLSSFLILPLIRENRHLLSGKMYSIAIVDRQVYSSAGRPTFRQSTHIRCCSWRWRKRRESFLVDHHLTATIEFIINLVAKTIIKLSPSFTFFCGHDLKQWNLLWTLSFFLNEIFLITHEPRHEFALNLKKFIIFCFICSTNKTLIMLSKNFHFSYKINSHVEKTVLMMMISFYKWTTRTANILRPKFLGGYYFFAQIRETNKHFAWIKLL